MPQWQWAVFERCPCKLTAKIPNIHDLRTMIKLNTFQILTPYFINATTIDESVGYRKAKAEKLLAENPLIDPYTPFHLYTSILSSKSLQLPNWSLEASMKNINAFFTLYKLLLAK